MKYLEKYQLVTLEDDKEYAVTNSILYEEKNFIYLMNIDDPKDQTIALVSKENDEINIDNLDYQSEENKELIDILSKIFIENKAKKENLED